MVATVRLVHALYVAFVVTSPVLVMYAALARRRWSRLLATAHVAALAFIALQYALGWPCPLSVLENRLAGRAADAEFLPALQADPWFLGVVVAAYLGLSMVGHAMTWRQGQA